MLTHHRSVSLSFISTNLPILNNLETVATLYERENHKFHLVLSQGDLFQQGTENPLSSRGNKKDQNQTSLLWLDISPFRVIMTKQSQESLNYRYFWEQGIYGTNRYWLNDVSHQENYNFRLRNFTRRLTLEGNPIPKSLRIDYELWSDRLSLGHYILHLEINN
jgi:hypothetical protein